MYNFENKFLFICRYLYDDEIFLCVIKLFDEVFKGLGFFVVFFLKWC